MKLVIRRNSRKTAINQAVSVCPSRFVSLREGNHPNIPLDTGGDGWPLFWGGDGLNPPASHPAAVEVESQTATKQPRTEASNE